MLLVIGNLCGPLRISAPSAFKTPSTNDDILPRMDKLHVYGYVACLVGAAALITGLLPQDKMEKITAFMHEHFGKQDAKTDERVSARTQLIIFGAFFLFIGLIISGLIRL